MSHIKKTLPNLKIKIERRINEYEQELSKLGALEMDTAQNKGAFLLHLISKFSSNYIDMIDGRSHLAAKSSLCGGAKISYIFHSFFAQNLKSIEPLDHLRDEDIRKAIRSSTVYWFFKI